MWYSQGPLQHESAYMSCMVPMLTIACRVCTSRRCSKGVESRGMRHHMVSAWQSLVEWILTLAGASEERSSALQGSWGRANIATHNGQHAHAPCKMQAHSQTQPQVAAGKCTFQLKLAGNCAVGMSKEREATPQPCGPTTYTYVRNVTLVAPTLLTAPFHAQHLCVHTGVVPRSKGTACC